MATPTITQALKSALPPIRTRFQDENGNITQPWITWLQSLVNKLNPVVTQFLSGTHAQRVSGSILASAYPSGSIYYETDRKLWYVAINATWTYLAGIYAVTQSNIPQTGDIGTGDTGLLVYVSDYAHLLQWNGAAFSWAPGEQGSGFISAFVSAPSPADGWALCDGSNVIQMLSDGTLNSSFVALPNTPGSYFRQ